MRSRRNADESLRDLERRASGGDPEALARLLHEKRRAGKTGSITLGELAAMPADDVALVLRELPDELGGAWWRTVFERPRRRTLPAMTHEQIRDALRSWEPMSAWPELHERAVHQEAEDLSSFSGGVGRRRRPVWRFTEQARTNVARETSRFLANESDMTPENVFRNRTIYVHAWAIAEHLRDILPAQEAQRRPGIGEPLPPVSQRLRWIFDQEIGNERHGGVSPATLDSTLDSVRQGMYGEDISEDEDLTILAELQTLISRLGGDHEISGLAT